MPKYSWKQIIRKQNLLYYQICSIYKEYYPNVNKDELMYFPQQLYQKIVLLSNIKKIATSKEIENNITKFQKKIPYKSDLFEEIVPGEKIYIRISEREDGEWNIDTALYLLVGFLLVHGEEYLKGKNFSIAELRVIYYALFEVESMRNESVAKVFYESLKDVRDKEKSAEEKINQMEGMIIVTTSLKKFLTGVDSFLSRPMMKELKNKLPTTLKEKWLIERLERKVSECCQENGTLEFEQSF